MKRENKKSLYYWSCRVSWDFYFSFWLGEIRSIYEKVKGSYLTITPGLVFFNMASLTNMKTVVTVPSNKKNTLRSKLVKSHLIDIS